MNPRSWNAGTAAVIITPSEPMWLAGWAARRQPATGKAMELFAKAVAFEDARGERVVIVTTDLIAVPRELATAVAKRLAQRRQIPRERILFNASHTHTAPEVRPDKVPFFEIPPEFAAKIPAYVKQLEEKIVSVIETAIDQLRPATLRVHKFHAEFAVNRRSTSGTVDHDVPVLIATEESGAPIAILFGYACHNLTLPPTFCEFHGDYAGVAQALVEKKYPGACALFLAGAGADQDPTPRGTVELVQLHGRTLAEEITGRLARDGRVVAPSLRIAFEDVVLDLLPVSSREKLEEDARSDDAPLRRKAQYLLAALAEKRPLAQTQRCPVHVIQFGAELLLIALGGEPVADYAQRFKREYGGPLVWVAGYSNEMFGYLPTRQVQQEGGYEGGRAVLWSAVPAPLAETSEQRVVEAVGRLVGQVRTQSATSPA